MDLTAFGPYIPVVDCIRCFLFHRKYKYCNKDIFKKRKRLLTIEGLLPKKPNEVPPMFLSNLVAIASYLINTCLKQFSLYGALMFSSTLMSLKDECVSLILNANTCYPNLSASFTVVKK